MHAIVAVHVSTAAIYVHATPSGTVAVAAIDALALGCAILSLHRDVAIDGARARLYGAAATVAGAAVMIFPMLSARMPPYPLACCLAILAGPVVVAVDAIASRRSVTAALEDWLPVLGTAAGYALVPAISAATIA